MTAGPLENKRGERRLAEKKIQREEKPMRLYSLAAHAVANIFAALDSNTTRRRRRRHVDGASSGLDCSTRCNLLDPSPRLHNSPEIIRHQQANSLQILLRLEKNSTAFEVKMRIIISAFTKMLFTESPCFTRYNFFSESARLVGCSWADGCFTVEV